MELGEKIRLARLNAGMTQSQLAGDFITRNMLSQIENGIAMPSVQTVMYIADKLGIDVGLLFSDSDDKTLYFITRKLPMLKKAYADGDTDKCMELCMQEGTECDEALLILAECCIKKAYEYYKSGKLRQALKASESAVKYGSKSLYSSDSIRFKSDILEVMASCVFPNIKQDKRKEQDVEIYKEYYMEISGQKEYYTKSIEATKMIERGDYADAVVQIREILKKKYLDVPFVYGLYCDLETCYRELKDYENAYNYSQKAKKIFGNMQQ